jgi:hypothetical protein
VDNIVPDETDGGIRKAPTLRGFLSAPKRTRTSTDHAVHQALNMVGKAVGTHG